MAQVTTEVATETIEAVEFGVMTDEEVKKLSVRNITNPNLLNMVGRPELGGLYDPALGPFDDHSLCKTCGQRSHCCPGHCGHIDLVSLLYHPLLFNMLYRILQNTCLSCYHFKAPREEVKKCISKLNFIKKGEIVRARELDSDSSKNSDQFDKSHNWGGFSDGRKCKDQHDWTSFQLTEAHSVLNLFLKTRSKECSCGARSPRITKPTFAWLHKEGLNDQDIKTNVIKGHRLDEPLNEEDDEKSLSEVENATDNVDRHVKSKGKNKKNDETYLEFLKWKKSRPLLPTEVREIFKRLWENDAELCSFICDIHQLHTSRDKAGFMMFFLKTLVVPPLKFRPPARAGEAVMEHPQTVLLGKVLESNLSLANVYEQRSEHNIIVSRWMNLQQSVNVLFDSKSAAGIGQKDMGSGICQLLEKKEGMFRQKMMGKRVNFACRSVISPDPYLAVNEIGIPPVFALRLTYPERVTPWNVTSLREAIVNGPDIHPGATHYVDKMSTVKLPPTRKSRIAYSRKLPSSRGVTSQPGKIFSNDYEGKVVQRHLRNGDIVLVNRQPTLHKPSIIALKVRVLPGERTIRFHYANCDSFNADFDGDEINVHFPQDEISRAEAYNIVNADNQYIVPTRGDPKRALIQDHIVGAVLLTKRDTFLTLEDFNELLYMSGICSYGVSSFYTRTGKKISVVDSETFIQAHPPTIVRPQRLWTGKQVITAILNHITRGSLPFTVKKRGKIAREYFGRDESRKNNVSSKTVEEFSQKKKNRQSSKKKSDDDLTGNINKASQEQATIKWNYTHNIDEDIVFVYKNELVQGIIDKEQFGKYGLVHTIQELYGSNAAGKLLSVLSRVLTAFLQMHGFTCGVHDLLLQPPFDKQREKLLQVSLNCGEDVHQEFIGHEKEHLDFSETQIEIEKAIRRNGDSAVAYLDGMMRSKLNTLNSAVTKLFPEGLVKPFRKNCLSLMTLSGAKGGTFNFQQISLLLGQQELEGKRVPRMVSGKTLPCFVPWDSSARAGGFISDRFLTGLRPQEFYFHCMAGREGLVDTAVKTSRSGYLQRCLIKNLECLSVHYDYTIRDADGSIIQFRYGEDGVDVHKKNFMQEFEALNLNQELIVSNNPLSQVDDVCVSKYVEIDNEVPNQLAKEAKEFLENNANHRRIRSKEKSNFLKLVNNKYYTSLAQPGEPVGIIAAQSIGEPSTQMTLNTFHNAGRGEMNVTLGIPRLQEILMTASVSIKTPTMTCPLLKSKTKDDAEQLASKLKRITVADLIENMEVSVVPFAIENNVICSIYKLKIKLYDPKLYPPHTDITLEDCHETLQCSYLAELEIAIEKHLMLLSRIAGIRSEIEPKGLDQMDGENKSQKGDDDNDDDDDDDDDDGNEERTDDLGSQKKKQARDEIEYDDSDQEVEERLTSVKAENNVALNENDDDDDGGGDDGNDSDDGDGNDGGGGGGDDDDDGDDGGDGDDNGKDKMEEDLRKTSTGQEKKGKQQIARKKKKNDKAMYVSCEGLCFEVHFKLIKERHILLAQIAEKAAKKVYVKSAGKIEQCKVVEIQLDDSGKGGIPMIRKGKNTRLALQTAGVDFTAFWSMQDELDIRFISSNDVNAMLNTYGVEAARATIVAEVFTVFGHYGVTVDMRHLSLIADYMTQTGGYRPMSRSGGIGGSISPLGKMSYETASKFLTQAATHGEVDNLETPSARICLGLPAKVGTGCFDLMHDLNV